MRIVISLDDNHRPPPHAKNAVGFEPFLRCKEAHPEPSTIAVFGSPDTPFVG